MTSGPRNIHTGPKGRNARAQEKTRGRPGVPTKRVETEKERGNQRRPRHADAPADAGWIWGAHAAAAALANPDRRLYLGLLTRNAAQSLSQAIGRDVTSDARMQIVDPAVIDAEAPGVGVHQGAALLMGPPRRGDFDAFLKLGPEPSGARLIVLLDQVTDPQNVGAVLRSAAAFGARGLVLQDRKAPPLFGACAKAAVGAAERVPVAHVVNLARALDAAAEAGWISIGLAGGATLSLPQALDFVEPTQTQSGRGGHGQGVILALGSEDKGLRPVVAKACAHLAAIPLAAGMESLNVASAAAISLYAAAQRLAETSG